MNSFYIYRNEEFGELSVESALAYYEYGNALLAKEEENPSNDFLGSVPNDEEKNQDQPDDEVGDGSGGEEEKGEDGEGGDVKGEDGEGEDGEGGDEEGDQGGPVDDIQVAWEVLDVSSISTIPSNSYHSHHNKHFIGSQINLGKSF